MSTPSSKRPVMQWMLSTLTRPLPYVLAGGCILLLDYATGRFIMFPILFVIPVTVAAWFYTKRAAYLLAVLLPIGRLFIAYIFEMRDPLVFLSINAIIRIAVLCFLTLLTITARQAKYLEHRVKQLEAILPICMFCKRIRDDQHNWQQLESYITEHSSSQFSHGLCADCQKKHYGEFV